MKIKKAFLLSLALVQVGIAGFSTTVLATTGAGGQVQSKGQITFYEGSLDSSSTEPSTTESSTSSSSTSPSTTKPQGGGTYPSTGEIVQKYSLMGVGIVAAVFLLVFFKRRKKEEE